MAKVYYDELNAAMNSDIFDRLATDQQETQSLKEVISNFIQYSTASLTGEVYDKYRTQLQTFNQVLDQRISLDENMSSSIKEALQLLINYMDGDLYLDTSKLNDYTYNRDICINSINKLYSMLNEMYEIRYVGSDGRTHVSYSPVYDSNEVKAQIAKAEETLKELDRIITKVQGLDAVYAQAEAILNSAFAGISPFGSAVTGIKPDGLFSYRVV